MAPKVTHFFNALIHAWDGQRAGSFPTFVFWVLSLGIVLISGIWEFVISITPIHFVLQKHDSLMKRGFSRNRFLTRFRSMLLLKAQFLVQGLCFFRLAGIFFWTQIGLNRQDQDNTKHVQTRTPLGKSSKGFFLDVLGVPMELECFLLVHIVFLWTCIVLFFTCTVFCRTCTVFLLL